MSELNLNVLVDANPKYLPQNEVSLLVENIAENVTYRHVGVYNKAGDNISFIIDNDSDFVDRNMFINWSNIPLKIKLITPVTVTQAEYDNLDIYFHEKIFKGYTDLCMAELGMQRGIQSVECNLDSGMFPTRQYSEAMKILPSYYRKDEMAYIFDCSVPDKTTNFNSMDDAAAYIPTYGVDGAKMVILNSKLSNLNPFSPTVDEQANSRTPFFKYEGCVATANGANFDISQVSVTLHNLSTPIAINVLGTIGDETPLYNINKMILSLNLHSNWASRIFASKPTVTTANGSVTGYKSKYEITLDRAKYNNNESGDIEIHYRTYKAPNYIAETMRPDSQYIYNYPFVELDQRSAEVVVKENERNKSVSAVAFDIHAVPKKIYVAVVPKKVSDEEYLCTPNYFGRVDDLSVELLGRNTPIATGNGSEVLYNISKENGLNMNKQEALYLKGFPVCIDTSNNLSANANTFVGVAANAGSGKQTVRINLSFTSLARDVANNLYTLANLATTKNSVNIQRTYEIQVLFVYSAYLTCNMFGKKFERLSSLTNETLLTMDAHLTNLTTRIVPKMNAIGGKTGGSWISAIGPALKNVGTGLFNVLKATIKNKDGLRDKLMEAYRGSGPFDGHAPALGAGGQQHNIIGGTQSLSKYSHY